MSSFLDRLPQYGPSNTSDSEHIAGSFETVPEANYSDDTFSGFLARATRGLKKSADAIPMSPEELTSANIEQMTDFVNPMRGMMIGSKGINNLVGQTYDAFTAGKRLEAGEDAAKVHKDTGYQQFKDDIFKVTEDIEKDIDFSALPKSSGFPGLFNVLTGKKLHAQGTEIIKNKELLKAYPELKNLTVTLSKAPEAQGNSYTSNRINLTSKDKKIFAHELQHFIDDIEDLPSRGANTEAFTEAKKSFLSSNDIPITKVVAKALEDIRPGKIGTYVLEKRINRAINSLDSKLVEKYGRDNLVEDFKSMNSFNLYRLNVGEQRARKAGTLVGNKNRLLGEQPEQSKLYDKAEEFYGRPSDRVKDYVYSLPDEV